MEQKERAIVVSSSRAQKKYVIQSKATTLGEFKEECRQAGIDYSGLIFKEAISNTEMLDDNSLLPREVLYKGSKTNNLVFSLTMPRKDIGSGTMDRKEAMAKIKELGLQDLCNKCYGNNYTRVSTANLEKLIETYKEESNAKHAEAPAKKTCTEKDKRNVLHIVEKCNELVSLARQLETLADIIANLANLASADNSVELTASEIDDILKGM